MLPQSFDVGYWRFGSDEHEDLKELLSSSMADFHRSRGAEITILQGNGSSVWIKYPKGSVGYIDRAKLYLKLRNDKKRKKLRIHRICKELKRPFKNKPR